MPLKQALILILAAGLATSGCSRGKNPVPPYPGITGASGSLALTRKQVKELQLETTKIQKQAIDRIISCTGRVALPASANFSLSAPEEGLLHTLFAEEGNYVTKGTVLAEIHSSAFLTLQQEYLVKKSLLNRYEEEFKRQGELTLEDASSIKKLQQAESDFRTTEVDCRVLSEKLALLGMDADSLHIGNVTSMLRVIAPGSGYLSAVELSEGSHASQGQLLFRIVQIRHPYLKLSITERYAEEIQPGQTVRFSFHPGEAPSFEAVIKSTGFEIDEATGSLEATADILFMPDDLLPGRRVYAGIETGQDSAFVLPSKAVVHDASGSYLVMSEGRTLTRIRVDTGQEQPGLTEVLPKDENLLGMDFVVTGAEVLNSWIEPY